MPRPRLLRTIPMTLHQIPWSEVAPMKAVAQSGVAETLPKMRNHIGKSLTLSMKERSRGENHLMNRFLP